MAMHPNGKKEKNGKKEMMNGKEEKPTNGLTAGQKKLPPALQAAILKKKKK